MLFPITSPLVFLGSDSFHLFTQGGFAGEIVLLFGSQIVEMLLMALVDDSAGSLKPCPDLLTQILCYRTNLAIFLM